MYWRKSGGASLNGVWWSCGSGLNYEAKANNTDVFIFLILRHKASVFTWVCKCKSIMCRFGYVHLCAYVYVFGYCVLLFLSGYCIHSDWNQNGNSHNNIFFISERSGLAFIDFMFCEYLQAWLAGDVQATRREVIHCSLLWYKAEMFKFKNIYSITVHLFKQW